MKPMKKVLLAMVALVMMFALAACNGSRGTAKTSGGGSGNGGDTGTVTLGYSGPLSGGAAQYGKDVLNGIKMAVKEINGSGGFTVNGKTYKYDLKALDDKYQPSQTAINGQKLSEKLHAPIIFCPHSGGILALEQFNEQKGFIIGGYTSVPSVFQQGNSLTVRIPPSFATYPPIYTKYEMNKFGKKLAMLPTNSDYGKAWEEIFKKAWTDAGGTVVYDNPLDYNNSTDFNTGVSKAISKKPDVMLIGGPSEPTGLVLKQARQLGYKGGFAMLDQAKLYDVSKVTGGLESLNGTIGVLPLENYQHAGVEAFIKNYKKAYGQEPAWESAWNYVATYVFTKAMEKAGTTTDAKKIYSKIEEAVKALPEDKNFPGIKGLSKDGGFNDPPALAVVENGKIQEYPKK
ncbi:MAG TPA: ABC transporter substrate-binding protein [Bacillales bacterium]|nr:ABC transporter substrate-binding protein [Bacillales bacterium]